MPLNTKRRFLISLQLGSIYLTRRGQFAARPTACLARGCPPKLRRWVLKTPGELCAGAPPAIYQAQPLI
jgi:hypothetical protein